MTSESAEAIEQGGYYISVSNQQPDGPWKLAWLASNYDAPPAMPSPPDMAPMPAPEAGLDETLEGLRSAWEEQYNAGNAEAVGALYTEDAVAMFADQAAVEGSAAIQASPSGRLQTGRRRRVEDPLAHRQQLHTGDRLNV
jgi:hypothetical protein